MIGAIITLSACQTYEGLKNDFGGLDLGSFTTAESVANDAEGTGSETLIKGDCPTIEIVDELSMLHEFTNPKTASDGDLISKVAVQEAQSGCAYTDGSVTVDLKLAFNGMLGPKGRTTPNEKPFFSYPFFVAVTSSGGKILAKEVFSAALTYEPGQNTQNYTETMRQIIPADSRAKGKSYKIMVGFQLTQDQLAYNRTQLQANPNAFAQISAAAEQNVIRIEKTTDQTAGPIDIQ
ncbi:MAG: hypothetical protein ACPGRX_06245 [Bdellovibrionales bacterium]